MWNRWVLFICFGIIALSVASCSYASNETNILNNTENTVCINTPSVDLESNNQNNDILDNANSEITIYYGERIDIDWENDGSWDGEFDWDFNEHCNCTVYIDNKLVSFIQHFKNGKTINMYNYDYTNYFEDFLNSIYPNVGLHNISIIFEFDTPQKYDITINQYKDEFEDRYICNVLLFQFKVNDVSEAKKRYSYNANLNIIKKDKTVYITNISSFATYSNELLFNVIVDNPKNSSHIFISNKTGIVAFDSGYGMFSSWNMYDFDKLRYEINPGIYNLTIVNAYDNTFDTKSFILYNDININTTYKIKDNNVILNVEIWCEYNTPIQFIMNKLIDKMPYEYRVITKEILAKDNNHKIHFEICFSNVDNNDYYVDIQDYQNSINGIYFTVNYTFVNETETNIEDFSDIGETDNVEKNVSKIHKYNNTNGNGTKSNSTGTNLNLKRNNTNSNSHESNISNNNFKEEISEFGDLASIVDPVSSEHANSYELIEKSTSKSSDNIFANLGIIILLLIALIVGFLRFKREN